MTRIPVMLKRCVKNNEGGVWKSGEFTYPSTSNEWVEVDVGFNPSKIVIVYWDVTSNIYRPFNCIYYDSEKSESNWNIVKYFSASPWGDTKALGASSNGENFDLINNGFKVATSGSLNGKTATWFALP